MEKKRETKAWALWNYDTLFGVEPTRTRCREYAATLACGGKEEADEWFRSGALSTSKVIVKEI